MYLKNANPSDADDVQFCMSIRNNPDNHKFFHQNMHITEEMQTAFMAREKYFYIIIDNEKRVGTISLYNINGDTGVLGRFFVVPEQRFSVVATLSEVLIVTKGFEDLGLNTLLCDIVQNNMTIINMHDNFGFKTYEEKDGIVYMRLNKNGITPFYHKMHKRFIGNKYHDFWR